MIRFGANLLWFLSTLPDYLCFRVMLFFPEAAQRRAERRSRRPGRVLCCEPTSGSTGPTKWIPYTEGLRREFLRAVNPWICRIYLRHPSLFFASHYWSLSPATAPAAVPEGNAVHGFADDREYLNFWQRRVSTALFAVPPEVGKIADPEHHALMTLLYLLANRRLGLISVWHPSFLLILLATGSRHAAELGRLLASGDWPDGEHHPRCRDADMLARALAEQNYRQLWPRLRLISCWDQARARGGAETLRQLFPGVEIEGKGLLATEGVVTIPWRRERKVAAIRSHRLHFRRFDPESGEESDRLYRLPEVMPEQCYTVYLTTGNGSRVYPLRDVVRCVGLQNRTPCFDFLYRAGGVCDLCGEKLHVFIVEQMLKELESAGGAFAFAMLFPRIDASGYVLLYDAGHPAPEAGAVEAILQRNYYYRHAVALGQLHPVRVLAVADGTARFRRHRDGNAGAVKPPPLYLPGRREEWQRLDREFFP